MRDKKIWMAAVLIAVLFFGAGFLTGKKSAQKKETIAYSVSVDGSVRDALDSDMGWGRSSGDLDKIEAVDVHLGVIRHDGTDAPSPAVALAIRNNGKQDLDSFGVSYSWQDLIAKKKICSFGAASGSIDAGWTSQPHTFDIFGRNMWQARILTLK